MRQMMSHIMAVLRGGSGLSPNRAEIEFSPDAYGTVAKLLLTPVNAPAQFVASLEGRLMSEPASATEIVTASPGHGTLRVRPRLLKAAAPVGVLAAVLAAIVFMSVRGAETPPPIYADVIRDSALRLYELDTVRYHVSVEADQGVCFTVTEHVPTEVHNGRTFFDWKGRQPVPPEQQSTYGCLGSFSQRHVEERGVYDITAGSFFAESRFTGKAIFPVTPEERDQFQSERMYVDGQFYARRAGGTWNKIPMLSVWRPFSFGAHDGGQIPVGDVAQLLATYENIEIVGTEQMHGVEVVHYRGSRNMLVGEETINAWIGAEDGLPHKATIVMTALEHETPLYWQYPGERRTDAPPVDWRFSPEDGWVQVMGNLVIEANERIPSAPEGHLLYSYEYEFSDFNEPVNIVPPVE